MEKEERDRQERMEKEERDRQERERDREERIEKEERDRQEREREYERQKETEERKRQHELELARLGISSTSSEQSTHFNVCKFIKLVPRFNEKEVSKFFREFRESCFSVKMAERLLGDYASGSLNR